MAAYPDFSLPSSNAFALLELLSTDAKSAPRLRTNRRLRFFTVHPKERNPKLLLDFNLFFGRRYLSFGHSASNDVRVPEREGIGRRHFALHFDMQTGSLLLTDTSPRGTRVSASGCSRELCGIAYPILAPTVVAIGDRDDCVIRITILDQKSGTFRRQFDTYVLSVSTTSPRAPHSRRPPLRTSHDLSLPRGKTQVASDTIHSGSRLSNGRIIAVKTLVWPSDGVASGDRVDRYGWARSEVLTIKRLRHVCIRYFECRSIQLTAHDSQTHRHVPRKRSVLCTAYS